MFNLMLESVLLFDELSDVDGTERETRSRCRLAPAAAGTSAISSCPRRRGADHMGDGEAETGVLVYLSYELPFKK